MKIAIIGSRSIAEDIDFGKFIPPDTELIISGGAEGVDTLAERYAEKYGIEMLIIRPDYEKYGKTAPLVRDREIVDRADAVYAFWDGGSRGTSYTIDYAKSRGKPCFIFKKNK